MSSEPQPDTWQQRTPPDQGYAGRHQQPHAPVRQQTVGYPAPPVYPAAGPPVAVAYPPMPAYSPYGNPLPPATAAALAPGVGAVVAFTLLSGVFGCISAGNRAGKARALGLPGTKYWVAFGATLAGVWMLLATLILAIFMAITGSTVTSGTGSVDSGATVMTVPALEQKVTTEGFTYEDGSAVPTDSVICTAGISVDARGVGSYSCIVDFTNGAAITYTVDVYSDGDWALY